MNASFGDAFTSATLASLVSWARSPFVVLCLFCTGASGEPLHVGLYGDSFLQPVADALDLIHVEHKRIPTGALAEVDLDSLDALFLAYDATDDRATIAWLEAFVDAGGKLFTFFVLPESLQRLHGLVQGEFITAAYDGQFAQISDLGTVPHLPASVHQTSWNIHAVEPTTDSTRAIATWRDVDDEDSGYPALLLTPAGAHLTHVLLGQDPHGAAQLFLATLAHFHPPLWRQSIHAILESSGTDSGPNHDQLSSRGRRLLSRAAASRASAADDAARGDFGVALQRTFEAQCLTAAATVSSQALRTGEMHGLWINQPQRISDQLAWRDLIDQLVNAGINALFMKAQTRPQIRSLPLAIRSVRQKKVEVHAWRRTYNVDDADRALIDSLRRDGRLQKTIDGEDIPWMCPSHPANIAEEVRTVGHLVRDYEVDGVHLDYIRYVDARSCFDDGCRARFESDTGLRLTRWPDDVVTGSAAATFESWRRQQVTALVRAISIRVRSIRPDVWVSVAVFSDWPQTRRTLGQDWIAWIDEGLVDFVCPMNYTTDFDRFDELARRQVQWVDGRVPLYLGIGAWQIPSIDNLLLQIESARNHGADGFVLFAFEGAFSRYALPVFAEALSIPEASPPHWGPTVAFDIQGFPHVIGDSGGVVYTEGNLISVVASVADEPSSPKWTSAALSFRRLDDEVVCELGRLSKRGWRRLLPFLPKPRQANEIRARLTPLSGDYRLVVEGRYESAAGRKRRFVKRGPLLRVRSQALVDSLRNQVTQ